MSDTYGHWEWEGPKVEPKDYLGFIYVIKTADWYYVGRKQIWHTRKGKRIRETDWKTYKGSSRHVARFLNGHGESGIKYEILAFFNSKSYIRYSEAYAIIGSLSYERGDRGINYSFEGAKGPIARDVEELSQLHLLKQKVRKLEKEFRQ